jgi:reverse gyrase
MSLYDEYLNSRNEAIFNMLNKLGKGEIINLIIKNSSEDYLEAMYEALRDNNVMG